MKYKCINKLDQFDFKEASIASIQFNGTTFSMDLDNVTIKANNEHNRDIQDMRANNVLVSFPDTSILTIIEEGYKLYDANNNLTETVADKTIPSVDYKTFFENIAGNFLYSITITEEKQCTINIDGEYQTYTIQLSNSSSCVEWDRFLKKEQ